MDSENLLNKPVLGVDANKAARNIRRLAEQMSLVIIPVHSGKIEAEIHSMHLHLMGHICHGKTSNLLAFPEFRETAGRPLVIHRADLRDLHFHKSNGAKLDLFWLDEVQRIFKKPYINHQRIASKFRTGLKRRKKAKIYSWKRALEAIPDFQRQLLLSRI